MMPARAAKSLSCATSWLISALAVAATLLPGGSAIAAESVLGGGEVRASLRAMGLVTGQLRPGLTAATDLHLPTWQMLTLDGRNLGNSGVFASAYGFLQQQWADGPAGRGADLVHGHIGWEGLNKRVRVQAGRLSVFAGAPRYVFLDGVAAAAHLPANLRLDAYAGTGVYETTTKAFEAPVFGGRLAWTPWEIGHVGVALQSLDTPVAGGGSAAARRTIGVDAALRLYEPLLLTGSYAHDLLGGRLQEARLDANYRLSKYLSVFALGELRDPLAWLPKTSIFNAFVDRNDGIAGAGFDLDTPGALTLSGGYDRYLVADEIPDGYRGYLEARLRIDPSGRYKAGLQYARLNNRQNGYDQGRLWASAKASAQVQLSCELDTYLFHKEIRGETVSLRGLASVRWMAKPGVQIGLDAQAWQNPYFTNQALAMVSLQLDEGMLARPITKVPLTLPKAAADEEEEEDEKDGDKDEDKDEDADKDEDKDDEKDEDKDADKDDAKGDAKSSGDKAKDKDEEDEDEEEAPAKPAPAAKPAVSEKKAEPAKKSDDKKAEPAKKASDDDEEDEDEAPAKPAPKATQKSLAANQISHKGWRADLRKGGER
jgi:hypothetical protein